MQIVCAAQIEDEEEIDLHQMNANISTRQGSKILDYYRKLYGDNPSFFDKLTQLVRSYNGKVQPISTNPDANEMLRQTVRSR